MLRRWKPKIRRDAATIGRRKKLPSLLKGFIVSVGSSTQGQDLRSAEEASKHIGFRSKSELRMNERQTQRRHGTQTQTRATFYSFTPFDVMRILPVTYTRARSSGTFVVYRRVHDNVRGYRSFARNGSLPSLIPTLSCTFFPRLCFP